MTVLLTSRNFQNSVMGLNSSSKKFRGNILFRNSEGSPDLSAKVEAKLNQPERYKRNSNVLLPSEDGNSMEVYKVFEDDGSGTVILTREGTPKKKGEGPEIFMTKISKSKLLEANPLPSSKRSVETGPKAVESAPAASPEQVAQVEAVPADPKLERALNTVIADVDTDKGIKEARFALETAAGDFDTKNAEEISHFFDDSTFQSHLSTGDKVSFTDGAPSSDMQKPFVSLGQEREGVNVKTLQEMVGDSRRERHENATTAEDIDVSLAEDERARHDQDTRMLTPDEMGELYERGKNDKDEELDLDEDEPHMVLDALLQKFEQSPTFDTVQADSFKKVISRLPKNEQGPMFQEIMDRIKAKRKKQDSEHRSKIEAALKNSPAGGRFEGIETSPEEFQGKLQDLLNQSSSAKRFESPDTRTDEELEAEDLERGRLHDSGEIWDSNIAYFNKKKRTQKINELDEKIKTFLAQEQGYLLDGAEENSPVLRLVDRELSALNKNIEKLRQEQKAEDLRGESYKKEADIDMSGFDEYVAPAPRAEAAPASGPTAPETRVDQAEAPKPKRRGLFGKIASGVAAVAVALGVMSGGGENKEKHTSESEPAGPAPASDSSMSSVETAAPLVSSNVSVEAPRARTNVSSPEASSSAPLMSESVPEVSSSRVEARRSSPRVSGVKTSESSSVEIPLAAKIESIITDSVRFNPGEDPTFQKLDKYNNTYFNVAENSLYKELGDKVMQIKFDEQGELRGGYIALKTSNENGKYSIKTKINFENGVMSIGDNNTLAPPALQEWAKKLQGEYDSYGKI